MAVFTPVGRDALDAWLARFDLGPVVDFRGIASGIENTNFFVTTQNGPGERAFVLTLFERLDATQLPFYLELMRHLATRGVPCPAPLAARDGSLFSTLNGKPAALVSRLPGRWVEHPAPAHCAAVGAALARLHQAGQDFPIQQPNLRGLAWWQATAPTVLPFLSPENAALLVDEVAFQTAELGRLAGRMPSGPIHADLFRDNALFATDARGEDVLGGFIDFYFAGVDLLLFDVAVCVNDWCVDAASGVIDQARAVALTTAYATVRPFGVEEQQAWNTLLRAAALRFWLSRLWDVHLPRPAQMLTPHDPTHFERILRRRRLDIHTLPDA